MKEQHQKPIYNKIVAAIPHSVSKARYFNLNDNIALTAQIKEWTDWFTDELFVTDTPGVTAIIGNISRFECDLERLEGEHDRIGKFLLAGSDNRLKEEASKKSAWRNLCLAEWYRYRAEILSAASEENTLIIDCHSFPCDYSPDVDICIGFNEDGSKPSENTIRIVSDIFKEAGYSVALNHPYSNAIAPIEYVGDSLMIEITKRTYMNEKTLQKNNNFNRLKDRIASVYSALLG